MTYSSVTVFGGSGFLGRYLVSRLARGGSVVRVGCRHPSRANFLRMAGSPGQVVPIATDVRSDHSVMAALKDAEVAFNLIGILHESGPWTFQQVHVEAAERIARCCAQTSGLRRLIHISAMGAELAIADSAYANSKLAGERAVRAIFPAATIMRPNLIFGPEDRFFNLFAWIANISPCLPLIGGGNTRFQPVYVVDVVEAMLAALADSNSAARTYELTGPKIYTFRSMMELMLKEIGRHRWLMPISWAQARALARVLELFPDPLLTRDQIALLRCDNLASGLRPSLADLNITSTALEVILPIYLARFRPGGSSREMRTSRRV